MRPIKNLLSEVNNLVNILNISYNFINTNLFFNTIIEYFSSINFQIYSGKSVKELGINKY